jgi:hypothetical protein
VDAADAGRHLEALEALARDDPFRFLRPEARETLKAVRDRGPAGLRARAELLLARRAALLARAVAEGWTPPPRP